MLKQSIQELSLSIFVWWHMQVIEPAFPYIGYLVEIVLNFSTSPSEILIREFLARTYACENHEFSWENGFEEELLFKGN